jgi:hypothetical protein
MQKKQELKSFNVAHPDSTNFAGPDVVEEYLLHQAQTL